MEKLRDEEWREVKESLSELVAMKPVRLGRKEEQYVEEQKLRDR